MFKQAPQVKIWSNWAKTVQAQPQYFYAPSSEESLQKLVLDAVKKNIRMRVVGSGHSFTALCASDSCIISLENLHGIKNIDHAKQRLEVWAGTSIKALGKLAHELGLAQENLGDIDAQSIAGATATGTHGTGLQFGGLSTQITAFNLLTAQGEILRCSAEERPEYFQAGRISLGALGIITSIELQLRPNYKLHYQSDKTQVPTLLENLESYKKQNRNFEFYWFPYTQTVQTKCSNETEKPVKDKAWLKQWQQNIIENKLLEQLCRLGRRFPSLYQRLNRLMAAGIGKEDRINYSHLIYATPREVRFKEMEYNVPQEAFTEVFRELMALMERKQYPVFFPIECRFVRGDEVWLSPSYGRDSAYLALHVYQGTPHEAYFADAEALFQRYEGRPHWGKMHGASESYFEKTYPKWQDFKRVRQALDPNNFWVNDYLKTLFSLD